MRFHFITLFPESIAAYFASSIAKRAADAGHASFRFINPRDYTTDKHHKADDRSFGGGPGMVLKAEPILAAVAAIRADLPADARVLYLILAPNGKQFTSREAKRFSKKYTDIILIAGHYEGVDARVKRALKASEYSIGPYVLTGGELPAAVIADAVSRHLPDVLGKEESLEENRDASPEVYTRPQELTWESKKYKVPAILVSGHAARIAEWRRKQSEIKKTHL